MEFLDMNLTKDSIFSLHAIHSLFYRQILKKTFIYSGLKNQTNTRVREDSRLCPEISTKTAIQQFHFRMTTGWIFSGDFEPENAYRTPPVTRGL
jgi:hypothetical protein